MGDGGYGEFWKNVLGLAKKYNKCHEEALQYIMGHSDVNMTLNYYAYATSDSALAEMERLIAQ